MNSPRTNHYTIACDRVFDPVGKELTAKLIEVRDGRFISVKPWSEAYHRQTDVEVFDLRGYTVTSPLVDPHIHAYMNPWPLNPEARPLPGAGGFETELRGARKRLRDALLAGIGVVRDLGDPLGINMALAREAKADAALPQVVTAGCAVYREGRYGRYIGSGVLDCEQLHRAVVRLFANPAIDLIKVIPTGIVNFRKGKVTAPPQFSTDELRGAVTLAHAHGKMVAAHCSGDEGIRRAVEAGIDFIEHGYLMKEDTMELLAEKGLVWTPTLAPVYSQWNHADCCGWDKQTTANLRAILDRHVALLHYARSIGVKIMAGSDAGSPGVPHGGGLIRELELMEQAGIPAVELLTMATMEAAAWIEGEKASDRLAAGCAADFIVLRSDPTTGIGKLQEIEWVGRSGVVRRGKRSRMESDAGAEDYGLNEDLAPAEEEVGS